MTRPTSGSTITRTMALGIDLKNDYAFKCVFGSERHTSILIHLLNAVLDPPRDRRISQVEIRNPITEPVVLDDKLAILDIRAADQRGRLFNIEMQVVLHRSLPSRLLYYWAKTYSSQLAEGEGHNLLAPTISICFLDALLFPETDEYHLPFRLWNQELGLLFSEDQVIHMVQLPNFVKGERELESPLDYWLYLLNNGKGIEPEGLPPTLRFSEFEEALAILKTLTHDEIERERYEAREKARRDALTWQHSLEQTQGSLEQTQESLEKTQESLEQTQESLEQTQESLEQTQESLEQTQQELEEARREAIESHARGLAKGLMGQIRLCENLLQQEQLPDEQLQGMSLQELQALADQLRDQLTGQS